MQVSATLIAAQQAAREARTRLQMPQAQQAGFAAALEKTGATGGSFAPLPLKQTAPAQTAAPVQPQAGARLGMHLDITI